MLCSIEDNNPEYGVYILREFFNHIAFPYPNYLFTRKHGYIESKDDEMYKYGFESEGIILENDYYGYYDLTVDGTFEDIANFYKHSIVDNLNIDYESNLLTFNMKNKKIKMFLFNHQGENYIGTKIIYN